MDHDVKENRPSESVPAKHEDREPYETPVLNDHGTIADVTLGTFAGVGADGGIYS